jgi:phage-related protein
MARKIEVDLAADTGDFEKGMKSAATSVDKFEGELKSAEKSVAKFEAATEKADGAMAGAAGSFRGLDALASGLGTTLGIEGLDAVSGYAVGIADMADGMKDLVIPMVGKMKAAFAAMNATLLANPIILVVAGLAALTAAFVIAYKKSETFRNIVNGAFDAVKSGAQATLDAISDAVKGAAKVIGRVAEIITTPYRIAFQAIAKMWNATLGGFGISIPGFSIPFGPSFGGLSFTIPNIPTFRAAGGPLNAGQAAIVGERGPELFIPSGAGTVVPNGAMGRTEIVFTARPGAAAALLAMLKAETRATGVTL